MGWEARQIACVPPAHPCIGAHKRLAVQGKNAIMPVPWALWLAG